MPAVKIESILTSYGMKFERSADNRWKVLPGAGLQYPAYIDLIVRADGSSYMKIYMPVGRVPADATADFFKDIFRKNRDMGHGAFALVGDDTMIFIDTLELENIDPNEFEATLSWLVKSIDIYRQKLDNSKLPYLDAF